MPFIACVHVLLSITLCSGSTRYDPRGTNSVIVLVCFDAAALLASHSENELISFSCLLAGFQSVGGPFSRTPETGVRVEDLTVRCNTGVAAQS